MYTYIPSRLIRFIRMFRISIFLASKLEGSCQALEKLYVTFVLSLRNLFNRLSPFNVLNSKNNLQSLGFL